MTLFETKFEEFKTTPLVRLNPLISKDMLIKKIQEDSQKASNELAKLSNFNNLNDVTVELELLNLVKLSVFENTLKEADKNSGKNRASAMTPLPQSMALLLFVSLYTPFGIPASIGGFLALNLLTSSAILTTENNRLKNTFNNLDNDVVSKFSNYLNLDLVTLDQHCKQKLTSIDNLLSTLATPLLFESTPKTPLTNKISFGNLKAIGNNISININNLLTQYVTNPLNRLFEKAALTISRLPEKASNAISTIEDKTAELTKNALEAGKKLKQKGAQGANAALDSVQNVKDMVQEEVHEVKQDHVDNLTRSRTQDINKGGLGL